MVATTATNTNAQELGRMSPVDISQLPCDAPLLMYDLSHVPFCGLPKLRSDLPTFLGEGLEDMR